MRGGGGRERGGGDRHGRHEHADAPPARDRGVVHHDARADPRAVRARHRSRDRAAARHHGDPARSRWRRWRTPSGSTGASGRARPSSGHDGPAGTYPLLSLGSDFDEDIPVMAACLGFKTMRWAGGLVDGVILHTFVTDEALARCVAEVRAGAAEAGRDPAAREGLVRARDAPRAGPRTAPPRRHRSHGHLLPGLRRRAGRDERLGPGAARARSGPTRWCSRCRAPSMRSARSSSSSTSSTLIPEEWLPAAVGSAEDVRRAGARPVRGRRRRRHPPRLGPRRARAGRPGLRRGPPRGPLRGRHANPAR